MHYYQFNIGDYKSHTSGLSLIEDIAYRRLLDLYYLNERPFNGCSIDVAREIGMREHLEDVEYVLNKFFPGDGEGSWINKRAEEEIRAYRMKKKTAAAAGRASGKARRSKGIERAFDSVEPTIKHKPITNNHKPLPKEINAIAWGEFEQHRKEIKKPLSELARGKAINTIVGLSFAEQAKVIDKTIQNRWTGLFLEKTNEANKSVRQSGFSSVIDRLAERESFER